MIAPWFADQPAPVRGVLWLASLREDGPDPAHDEVMALFLDANQADAVREVAALLGWIYKFETEATAETVCDWYEVAVPVVHADVVCDVLAGECRRDAVRMAQLVASTLGRKAAAA